MADLTTRQKNYAGPLSKCELRVGAAYTQTGVLAKGGAKGSAGEIEELGRKLGLAGARPPQGGGPPRGGDRHASPLTGDPRGAMGLYRACLEGVAWAAPAEGSPTCADHRGRQGRLAARALGPHHQLQLVRVPVKLTA